MADPNIPVTRIRLQIPRGMRIEDVLSKLEISFETVEPDDEELARHMCCQDAVVLIGAHPNIKAK
jgi:sulfopyruvate decarboxylase TPP-binding subunit